MNEREFIIETLRRFERAFPKRQNHIAIAIIGVAGTNFAGCCEGGRECLKAALDASEHRLGVVEDIRGEVKGS
jgi:hypothetical protein